MSVFMQLLYPIIQDELNPENLLRMPRKLGYNVAAIGLGFECRALAI